MRRTVKRAGAWLLLTALVGLGCSSNDGGVIGGTEIVVGSGVVVQEDRSVAGFSGVQHSSEGDVDIRTGATEALTIVAENNLLPHILSDVQGSTLLLRTASGIDLQPRRPIEFQVTAVDLDRLTLSGVGRIEADGFSATDFLITLAGVGDFEVTDLTADSLDVEHAGVGEIRVTGVATVQSVRLGGVGDYEAENLASVDAEIVISGEGSATVRVSGTLTVTISGVGSVYYYGDPAVQSTITGNGQVVRLGP